MFRQSADLIARFDGHAVLQPAGRDLIGALLEASYRSSKAPAREMSEEQADQKSRGRKRRAKPNFLPHRGVENRLRMLHDDAPAGRVEAGPAGRHRPAELA